MNFVGIIAEYDPFHSGHALQLRMLRQRGASTIAVCMSTGVVQRGGVPILPEAVRVRAALAAGADLVVALPAPYANASAEQFAAAGVHLLAALGCDTLAFGAETPEPAPLQAAAAALCSAAFPAALRSQLESGLPFAAARQRALERMAGGTAAQGANDLLATEYLRFLPQGMEALAVMRRDGPHNGARSASQVRRLLKGGHQEEACALLPDASAEILRREREQGRCPASLHFAERAVLYRLRTMTAEDFAAIPDCSEGLEHRLVRAAGNAATLEEFYALAKTKRYAHARIRRIALRAFLGLTELPRSVPYLRVLGANGRGVELLRQMKRSAGLPIITKPAHGRGLKGEGGAVFAAARQADDLWGLCLEKPLPTGWSWKAGPVLLG